MATNIIDILILSTLAGLGTGLGGFLVVLRKTGAPTLGFFMGFAAGIMIMLSFLELLSNAISIAGLTIAAIGFLAGALVMFILDFTLPHRFFKTDEVGVLKPGLFKSGILIAIGISLHNLPEGIAIATGYSFVPTVGIAIAIAMALHNIPEGMAIALPCYMGGASRGTAFKLALVSGLVEPFGALLASIFLFSIPGIVPLGLAFAGGVMVFVTLDELIPVAHKHGHEHYTTLGVIIWCAAMFAILEFLG
jgi:ZIP family zinc transporter